MAYKKQNHLWKFIGIVLLILILAFVIFFLIRPMFITIGPGTFDPTRISYSVSPCNQEDTEVFANITINPNFVTLHQKASYVCCANITLRYEINGSQLNIYEDNKGQICRCICNYEINARIPAKNITEVKVYGIYYPEVHPYELLVEYPAKNKNCAKEGEQFSKVYKNEYPEICCEGLTEWNSGFDTRKVVNGTCVETGLLAGSPVGTCIKCGDGICGLNENICNCPGDCKLG